MTRRSRMTSTHRRAVSVAAVCGAAALLAKAIEIAAGWNALKLSTAEAISALAEGRMIVLDVRTERERAAGTIPGAVATTWRHPVAPDDDRDVLVVCSHGGRSVIAVHALRGRGIEARSLRGGMKAYVRNGGASNA